MLASACSFPNSQEAPTALTSHDAVGKDQTLWLLRNPTGHLGHLHTTAQGSVDGEFLKWGLALGGMVVHILQEGSQVTPNSPGQPLSLPQLQPEPRSQKTGSKGFHYEAPLPSSQPMEET